MSKVIALNWSVAGTREDYFKLILENDWIWGQAQFQDFETSSLLDLVEENNACAYSGRLAIMVIKPRGREFWQRR